MKGNLHEEKLKALESLGYNQSEESLIRTLEFSLRYFFIQIFYFTKYSNEVSPQDIYYVLISCCFTYHGLEITWKFIKERF